MKEIFEQYGGAIITVLAVVALAAFIKVIIGTDATSPVYKAFNDLINSMTTFAKPGGAGAMIQFPFFRLGA